MAVELATGYVSIVPSARGFRTALSRELGSDLDRAGGDAGDRAARSFGSRFTSSMADIGKKAALGLSAGLAVAGGFGIKVAADFEQTTIAFEGILGSADQAKQVLGDLRDFAAKTPFEFTGLTDSAKQLLAVGFGAEDIIPTMTTLGNVAATLGVGESEIKGVVRALGQMKGKGKASAEELQQISEQVPGFSAINAIAQEMGVSTSDAFDLMAKGAIPADDAIAAILSGMEKFPGAAGAMDRQSKTLNGVISTFKDTLATTAIDFITPYLPSLASGVQRFGSFISTSAVPALKKFTDFIGNEVVPKIRQWWPVVVAAFQQVVGFVQQHWPEIQRIVGQVMETVQSVVSGVVSVITTLWQNFGNNILEFVQRVWPRVQQVIEGVMNIIQGVIKTVTSLIKGDWSAVWDGIKQTVSGVWEGIQGIIGAALETIRLTMGAALEVIGSVFKSAWSGIVDFFYGLPNKVGEIAGRLWEALKNGLKAAVKWIVEQLDKVLGPLDEIAGKVGGLIGGASGFGGGDKGLRDFLSGGERARGGPVSRGASYLIGEDGPEAFIPNAAGMVIPNHALGAGGPLIGNLSVTQMPGEDPVTSAMRELNRIRLQAASY